jgi:hypothetical protein
MVAGEAEKEEMNTGKRFTVRPVAELAVWLAESLTYTRTV